MAYQRTYLLSDAELIHDHDRRLELDLKTALILFTVIVLTGTFFALLVYYQATKLHNMQRGEPELSRKMWMLKG